MPKKSKRDMRVQFTTKSGKKISFKAKFTGPDKAAKK